MLYKKAKNYLAGWMLFGFILGVSRGYVAVWQDEDPQPYLTDTPVSSLLPADAALLRRGMRFSDQQSLTAALEDFCS